MIISLKTDLKLFQAKEYCINELIEVALILKSDTNMVPTKFPVSNEIIEGATLGMDFLRLSRKLVDLDSRSSQLESQRKLISRQNIKNH